jgi:hypothetical protein
VVASSHGNGAFRRNSRHGAQFDTPSHRHLDEAPHFGITRLPVIARPRAVFATGDPGDRRQEMRHGRVAGFNQDTATIHDIAENAHSLPGLSCDEIADMDAKGDQVEDLMMGVTRQIDRNGKKEPKSQFLCGS